MTIINRHGHPISSNIIKATVSMTYRDKQYLTCTEFRFHTGGHLKDIFAVKKDEMIEIEVKINKSDLLNDLKKQKHKLPCTINKFYYAVPEFLVDEAITLTERLNKSYGVICWDFPYQGNLSQGIHVAQNAQLLIPKSPVSQEIMTKFYRRLSYENGRLLMKLAKIEISGEKYNENN